jgi:hypothetical protein
MNNDHFVNNVQEKRTKNAGPEDPALLKAQRAEVYRM